ncbi:hypothetical protein FRC17_000106 [Serendipita sp. 399]|nr:hypothetical protein FRC17_000106 [Serendipita sp. 399]
MNQRQPSTTSVATPNQLISVNSLGHPAPPTGSAAQMAYAQPQYAAHPMQVGSMTPMAPMGAGGMPQQGAQTMYVYPPVAGPPGHPQGMPGGMPVVMTPVGAGRAVPQSMPLNAQVQPMARYNPSIGRGMAMPTTATMSGAGRGMPPATMVMPPTGMRMQPGGMQFVQRVGPHQMHSHPGQPGVGPGHPLGAQQGHGVMTYPASSSMGPQGVMMVPPQSSPIKQHAQLYQQTTGPNPTMGMQNGAPIVSAQNPPVASPVRNASPSASASAAPTPANAATPGQRGLFLPFLPFQIVTENVGPIVANAPTPTARPGTATHPPAPTGFTQHTPRMQQLEAPQSINTPPGSIQRNPSANPPPPGSMPQVNPGIFRQTPAQMVTEQQPYANMIPGSQQIPPNAARYPGQTPTGRLVNVPQTMPGVPSQPPPPGAPLQPQFTGSAQPLVPQHTGGSVHAMNETSMANQPGNSSVPSTPHLNSRAPNATTGGAMRPPSAPRSMGESSSNTAETRPQPTPPRGALPQELNAITSMGMSGGQRYPGPRMHSFGVLRLLSLSKALNLNSDPQKIPGLHDDVYWHFLLSQHFTPDAILSIRTRILERSINPFVELNYPLITRFFSTLSQANIYRMSFSLDGASESQEGQEYTVTCPNARWLMHYNNGWIISLLGYLRAKCRLVPMTPQLIPAQPKAQSPPNQSIGAGTSMVPYMAKICEMTFDVGHFSRSLDLDIVQRPPAPDAMMVEYPEGIPPEPLLSHGFPEVTMRMIEMVEGTIAIWPILGHAEENQSGPIDAMNDLVRTVSHGVLPQSYFTFGGRLPEGAEGYVRADGTTSTGFAGAMNRIPVKKEMTQDPSVPSASTAPSSTLTGPSEKVAATSSTSTAPSISPTLAAKTTGKKSNPAPGSPTKAGAEKEKGSSKRKSTADSEGPNKRRVTTRKTSKAS